MAIGKLNRMCARLPDNIRCFGILVAMALSVPCLFGAADLGSGEFWYLDGRQEYPGSETAVEASACLSGAPLISGGSVFDSGIGDHSEVFLASEFSSYHRGLCLSFR